MTEITILSGKGGTGKTSITAAIASVAEGAVYCDNDVDASDLHLIFKPKVHEKHKFTSGWKARINTSKCTNCEICIEHCRFDAIHYNSYGDLVINPYQCEGCRLCERTCPEHAISSVQNSKNHWFVSNSRFGKLVHAQMGPGEENSGKLVSTVRTKARELAIENKSDYIINDGPPGIGCATISSLSGTNSVLLVIEPTKSGLHDVRRLVELIETFNITTNAVLNKYDINPEIAFAIEEYLQTKHISLLAKIPFDKEMVESMNKGKTIIEYNSASIISSQIKDVWNKIKSTSLISA